MACLLCRIVFDRDKIAATERWLKRPWKEPNNGGSFFTTDPNLDALRVAHTLRKTEPEKAFQEFLRMAERGSIWSMRQVGSSYLLGSGTPVDRAEAQKWLQRGHEAGDEGAMLELANEYFRQNRFGEAVALLEEYAKKDLAPALYLLGLVLYKAGKKVEARAALERASALGHRLAKWSLSKLCLRGKFGIRSISYGFRLIEEIYYGVEKSGLEDAKRSNVSHPEVAK